MQFLRAVYAEWTLLRPLLIRTRFGVLLAALGAVLAWLGARGVDSLTLVLHAGALGAVLSSAFLVGSAADRAALAVALSHPTTPLAIATGRWIGSVVAASLLTIVCSIIVHASVGAATAGIVTATAVAGCALAAILTVGNGAAVSLCLFMLIAGTLPPERLVDLAHPGLVRLTAASALELGPALWHYRDIAAGDVGALLHAVAWAGLGVLWASAAINRYRR